MSCWIYHQGNGIVVVSSVLLLSSVVMDQILTGISAAGTGAIGGLTVKDEGTVVGTAGSISTFDFVGSSVVVTATLCWC